MRVLVLGWASFVHGEATAGDVAALRSVRAALAAPDVSCDIALSPVFSPGTLGLEDAAGRDYDTVVFACGPLRGWQVEQIHRLFPRARRVAVGTTVLDWADPAVTGFHAVLPRDGPGSAASSDLAAGTTARAVPVAGVALVGAQPEYSARGCHEDVHRSLRSWVARCDCAPIELDTRLDSDSWRHCADPGQFAALVARTDVVITTRLHGLVFALSAGVPALAVDPVRGGGKVSAQASVWEWPAVAGADAVTARADASTALLDELWAWCLSSAGRDCARARAARGRGAADALGELRSAVRVPTASNAGS